MSGNAMLTTNRSRLAMKTAAETTARTAPSRRSAGTVATGAVAVVTAAFMDLRVVSSFNEPTLVNLLRATAHIRRPGLFDCALARGDRRSLDTAGHTRRP